MSDIKNKNPETESIVPHEFPEVFEENREESSDETSHLEKNEDHSEKKSNPHLDAFLIELEKHPQVEAKVKCALDFMESTISQTGSPHFKSFWDVRGVCLQLFKENISPTLRAQFWLRYSELSKEARRLKDLLDEQSSFAAEQIEIAISALENDIEKFEEQVSKIADLQLQGFPKMLARKVNDYNIIQKKLNLLNVQASRVNGLRKELIKTEMRVRQKNKFFQRLSSIGDKIFPLRKELIKEISHNFSSDVDTFIKNHFTENYQDSLFNLREEIKGLQGIAKILTLNTHAFTQTRMLLSECWDKIKVAEKERKKERAHLKAVFKENFDAVQLKINEFKKQFEAGELSDNQAQKQLDEISKFMRGVELGRDEIKALRDELSAAKSPILERARNQEQARQQQEQEKEKQRRSKIDELKNEIEQLRANVQSLNAEELVAASEEINEKFQNAQLSKFERQELDRLIKPLKGTIADALSDKEEESLLALSADDRQAIEQLKEVLKQRKERRQEIKSQLENLRKVSGNSGLDFEKAMNHNQLVNSEKERLEKINQGIKEIEDKIAELQTKR